MRVPAIGHAFDRLPDVLDEAARCAAVTHDHPDGIAGAQATATAVHLARMGHSKREIRHWIERLSGYDLRQRLDDIRPRYAFDVSCQGTVPVAVISFLESHSYEGAVRNAVSLGGDADTLACIAGAIAEPFYGGVPDHIAAPTLSRLDDHLREVVARFTARYPRPPGPSAPLLAVDPA
jgi:ADP-ribosylglycohydrolase